MSDTYDVAIIGAGHNGLTAAAYLAKAGRKVVVLEKKEMIGGLAVTEELFPGFKVSSLVDGSNSFSAEVCRDLDLPRFGYDVLPTDSLGDPLLLALQKKGKHLTIWHDVERTAREIAYFSTDDAEAYPAFIEKMRQISNVLSALNRMPLPDMPDVGLKDVPSMLKIVKPVKALGWKNVTHMTRMLTLSLSDLLNEWFESNHLKAAIAASSLRNISLGPMESGTAFAFMQQFANSNNALFRSSGQVIGGIGALTQALAASAKNYGAKILTESEVTRITLQNVRASGLIVADGTSIHTSTIVSAIDMKSTFLELINPDSVDETAMNRVRNITYNGSMARVHYALKDLPNFTGLKSDAEQVLKGHIQIAPTIVALQKAFDPVKYGQFSKNPYLDIHIPTLSDSSLAPQGKHLMSVTVKYMPYHLREAKWEDLRDSLGQLVSGTITGYAPDFPECLEDTHIITPLDMEARYGLPEGSLAHGDPTLDQSLWMRPIPGYTKYNSPVDGLYLCGAATHPAGGVTGINGANGARRILKDKR